MRLYHCTWALLIGVMLVACTTLPTLNRVTLDPSQSTVLLTAAPKRTNGSVRALSALLTARAAHTATLLPNGKVLLVGGFDRQGNALASAELFDPTTNTVAPTGALNMARQSHTATILLDGQVLIAGGYGDGGDYLASVERYDSQTGVFTRSGSMTIPRAGHLAVRLADGTVLLTGGVTTGWTFLSSAERYDPLRHAFVPTGSMTVARESHTATLLSDGKVLIAGGHSGRRSAIKIYASAELYDPVRGRFTPTANLLTKRHKHDALLLVDGRVLLVGGADERDAAGQYQSAELYEPHMGEFTAAGTMLAARYKFQGTSVLLHNGKVLLMGGADVIELYDPVSRQFEKVVDGVGTARFFAAAATLPDGSVLLTGGYGASIRASADVWIFKP